MSVYQTLYQCDECGFAFREYELLQYSRCCPRCGDEKLVDIEGDIIYCHMGYNRGIGRFVSVAKWWKPSTWGRYRVEVTE